MFVLADKSNVCLRKLVACVFAQISHIRELVTCLFAQISHMFVCTDYSHVCLCRLVTCLFAQISHMFVYAD